MTTLSICEQRAVNPWFQPLPVLEGLSSIDHLYNRLDGMYPNKWRSNFADAAAVVAWRDTWAEALDEEGVAPHEIRAGLKACRLMFGWPPSLSEFLTACRPHLEPATAFQEAVRGLQLRARGENGEWSHPAIFHAALALGQHDVMNGSFAALEVRWKQALAAQLSKREWPEIPVATRSLAEPRRTESRNAEARKAMKNLKVDLQPTNPSRNWAQKILDNSHLYSHYSINCAREVAA